MDRVRIFDATLYGGGQSPGAALNIEEKLEIAHLLEQMGVDIIQAGFPIASPGNFEGVERIAKAVRGSSVCALARAQQEDIDLAAAALKQAGSPRIQIGLGVSDSYIQGKLKITHEEALEMGVKAVRHARRYVESVQYYPADACRADIEYLYRVLEAVIEAGATVINIPDAIGFNIPSEWGKLIQGIMNNVPNIDKATISVHCHNDLGMATANTIEAIARGARQAECAINGIGERTGNACLEEVVMTLQVRRELLGVTTGINTRLIHPASRLVSDLTGIPVQPNKAIVGANAFAYTSGMYKDGVLKGYGIYEVIDPAEVGVLEAEGTLPTRLGRQGLRRRLEELGYTLDEQELERVYARFKEVSRKKSTLDMRDLEAIVTGETAVFLAETYELEAVQVTCGTNSLPMAAICLRGLDGEPIWATSTGNGPVDAAYKAIDRIVNVPNELVEFAIQAITEGLDAVGKVTIRIKGDISTGIGGGTEERVFIGRGADTDIIVASAKAYLFALNRLLAAQQASRRTRHIAEEVRMSVNEMQARYGTGHQGDFWGYSALRDELLE
jgi:2-isopropylmalate synthase